MNIIKVNHINYDFAVKNNEDKLITGSPLRAPFFLTLRFVDRNFFVLDL